MKLWPTFVAGGFLAAALLVGPAGVRAMDASISAEIRSAERALELARSSSDPLAWVEHYTDDAIFVAPGAPVVQGREALTRTVAGGSRRNCCIRSRNRSRRAAAREFKGEAA